MDFADSTDQRTSPSVQNKSAGVLLTAEQISRLSLFKGENSLPTVFLSQSVFFLRRCHQGQILWRQGQSGISAVFFLREVDFGNFADSIRLLTEGSRDVAAQMESPNRKGSEREEEMKPDSVEWAMGGAVAAIHIATPIPVASQKSKGVLSWLFPNKNAELIEELLPVNAPRDVDFEFEKTQVNTGDVMVCLGDHPRGIRTGTLVVEKDWLYVEIQGKVLDLIESNLQYKNSIKKAQLRRMFEKDLKNLAFFQDLNEQQIFRLKNVVEFVDFQPGEVIVLENDLSDAIYIIRTGRVQVVKGQADLIGLGDIPDWGILFNRLKALEMETAPLSWQNLAPRLAWDDSEQDISDIITAPIGDKQEWLHQLNDFVKFPFVNPGQFDLPEPPAGKSFRELWPTPFGDISPGSLEDEKYRIQEAKQWGLKERARFGRNWIQAVLGDAIQTRSHAPENAHVLSVMSQGEHFGEMGLLADQPRSASCLAVEPFGVKDFVKAGEDSGVVELVRIPGDIFLEILADAPDLRRKIDEKIAKRNQNDQKLLAKDSAKPGDF